MKDFPGPLAPLRAPPGTLRQVGSYKKGDRVLQIMRYSFDTTDDGPLFWEDPMDQTFTVEILKKEPLPIPKASIFFMDYKYGDFECPEKKS